MMKFSLSMSQQKELLIRGKPLLIAIPLQVDCDNDEQATRRAKECLLLPDGCWIVSAEIREVEVIPKANPKWDNLTTLLGGIRGPQNNFRPLLVVRHVAIVAIVREKQERHPLGIPQWANGTIDLPHYEMQEAKKLEEETST